MPPQKGRQNHFGYPPKTIKLDKVSKFIKKNSVSAASL